MDGATIDMYKQMANEVSIEYWMEYCSPQPQQHVTHIK